MNKFQGQAISWQVVNGAIELALHREPCNEIGSGTLEELETFAAAMPQLANEAHALIVHSTMKAGFCAGADLRELYQGSQGMSKQEAVNGVREFRGSPRSYVWRRIRIGSGLRHYYCGSDGAFLLS
jgi:enoyl-CoA hydratase/carnithine racemase